MSPEIATIDLAAAAWLAAIGRACWQGSAAIGLVWALCRFLPRLSGRVQCWLWRLAYLKLLAAFLCSGALALPLLAPETPSTSVKAISPAGPVAAGGNERDTAAAAGRWLLLLWLLGVAGCGAQVLGDWRAMRRLRRAAEAIRDEDQLAVCRDLCRRLGIRRTPELLAAPGPGYALLVGVTRPAVVLPTSLPPQFGAEQFRLMLGHELAHLKRRDLLWAWLPSFCRALFFFHPLLWLAEGEWRLAHEIACDEQAVLSTGASPARYGTMLLDALAPRQPSPARLLTVSVVESYATVRRRLVAVRQVRPLPPRRRVLQCGLLAAVAAVGVLPWRLTSRPAPLAPPPVERSGRNGSDADPFRGESGRPLPTVSRRSPAVTIVSVPPRRSLRGNSPGRQPSPPRSDNAAPPGAETTGRPRPAAPYSVFLPTGKQRREHPLPSGVIGTHDRTGGTDRSKEEANEGETADRPPLAAADQDPVRDPLPVEKPFVTANSAATERIDAEETNPDAGEFEFKRPPFLPPKSMAYLGNVPGKGPFSFDHDVRHLKVRGEAPLDDAVIKKLLARGVEMSDIKQKLAESPATERPEEETELDRLKRQKEIELTAMERKKRQAAIEEIARRKREQLLKLDPEALWLKPGAEKIPWWKR